MKSESEKKKRRLVGEITEVVICLGRKSKDTWSISVRR